MPILWRLRDKPKRYAMLKRSLSRISHKMLAAQLQELERDGFITRTVFPTVPPSVEYSLTAKGRTTLPVIRILRSWGTAMKEGK